MATSKKDAPSTAACQAPTASTSDALREPAERLFAHELAALAEVDTHERPAGWKLSPRAVFTYIVGGKAGAVDITPKYVGAPRLVEIAIATLVTDRALLLVGEPGTAKSWLSEHLAAAISGDSHASSSRAPPAPPRSRSATRGTTPSSSPRARRRGRSSPRPCTAASPRGRSSRFEEITRCPSEVQDALITLLSEKVLAVPELGIHIQAKRGFSLIGTANTRDRGVNDMSAALKRRFNIVVLPVPADLDTEVAIVQKRVRDIGSSLRLPAAPPAQEAVRRVVQVFQELRRGQTADGKQKLKTPSGVLSTAEAISVLGNGMALAGHFGSGKVSDRDLAAGLLGAVVKEDSKDEAVFVEYLENVMKKRGGDWTELYQACKELT